MEIDELDKRIKSLEINSIQRAELNSDLSMLDEKMDKLRATMDAGFDRIYDHIDKVNKSNRFDK